MTDRARVARARFKLELELEKWYSTRARVSKWPYQVKPEYPTTRARLDSISPLGLRLRDEDEDEDEVEKRDREC